MRPRRSPHPRPTNAVPSLLFLSNPQPLTSNFCIIPLSSFFSSSSALFSAIEQAQPLSDQPFAHSFPFNGGGGGASFLTSALSVSSVSRKPRCPHRNPRPLAKAYPSTSPHGDSPACLKGILE